MDVPVSESDVVVTNGETSVKGGPLPPPSPLTGCYLLIVVGEPYSEEHKEIILQRIAKGLLSWDMENCHVDLEKELQAITDVAPEGEEARHGERLIQFATENLVTEVLIHPAANTLIQCMKNLLSSFTRHRHIIHSGYTFGGNGSWALQDGTFSLADFTEAFQENDVQRVIKAYENTITIDIHCSNEGDWSKLPKESYTKNCKVQVNPNDVLSSGSSSINSFVNYLSIYLLPADIESLLESSDVVGNIRFSHPTLYVFPGGQGDAALFGINGFNMLVDGGYARKACFWDFTRHLDRLDAVLVTRLNNSNVCGVSSVLKRKTNNQVYPQIGHFFCNLQERKAISPDGDKDKDPLLINLLYEGQDIISNLRQLNLRPQLCYRDTDPINLYHKVGHGTLDMYVLSPAKHSKEVKEFLHKWNTNDQRLFTTRKDPKEFSFPLSNLVSICALLVWKPANPSDTITRLLFPGSTPQHKIFEGLDRLKHLEFMKHPVCSAKSLTPSGSILGLTKSKQTKTTTVLDKILPSEQRTQKILDMKPLKERTPPQSENKQKIENKNEIKKLIEVNGTACEENKISKAEKVIKSNSVESDKSEPRSDTKKTELVNGKDVDILEDKSDPKQKTKVAESKPKQRMSSKVRSESTRRSIEKKPKIERKVELKPAPTTPKKTVDAKVNGVAKEKDVPKPKLLSRVGLKPSPTSTPAKSTKDANNRKVVELKFRPGLKKEPIAKKEPAKLYERKPISRRPKAASPVRATKTPASPSKKLPGIKTDKNGVSRTIKLDKEGTTDSSAVSTPSADQDTSKKIDESKLTKTELEELKAKEIADLKEEQEVVKEIEAVFRKDEKLNDSDQSDTRKIKDISIEEKTTEGDDEEEYIIVEKEEVEQNTDSVNEQESATKEDEIQKHQRDSEESEKPRKKSDAEKSGEKIPIVEEVPAKIEPEIQETKLIEAETCRVLEIVQPLVKEVEEIIIPTAEMTRSKEDSREKTEEMSKEVSVTSPEDKIDMSSEKKLTDTRGDVEEEENKEEKDQNYVLESQPDEKFSATIESGATTAPTLPEDERITLDEIKEDQVIEEKYAKEETKEEKEIPAVVVTQKPLEAISKISPIVGIKFEAHQSHIRDIVKTPDEVADLPMHEEVDIDTYDFPSAFKKDNKKMEAPIQKEQDESVKPIDKNEVKIDVVKVEPEEIETVEIKTAVEEKPEIQIQEVRLTEDKEDEKDIEAVIQDVTTETKVTVVIEQPSERTEEVLQEAQLQIKETIDETIENVPQETVASAEEIKITEQDIKLESTEVKEVDQDKEQAIDVPEDKTKDESTKLNETEQEIKDEVREQVETKEDGTEVEKEEEVKEENIDISIPTEIKDKVGDIMTTIKDAIAEITSASIQTEDLKQDETVIAPVAEEIDSAQIDESEAIIIKTITEPQVESVDDQQQDKTAVISDAKEIITDIIEEAERKTSIVEDTVIELSTIVAPETKLDAAEDIIEVKEEIDEMFVESKHPYKEEEIVKIVSSVALVLKSDAPLEELAATLPMEYGSPFKSFGLKGYTTELRETHITTLDSPVQEDAALPGKETYREDFAVCPKQSSIEFIDEEKKIAIPDPIISETQEKDISPQEKKISDLIKDSNALIASTSKIISDIKSAAVVDEVITEEHKAEDIKKTSEVLEDAEEIKKTSEVLEDADEIKKTCEVLEDAEEIKKTSEVLEDTEEIKKTSEVLEDVEVIKKTSEVLEDAKELSEKTEAANELIEKIEEDSNDIEALDVTEDTLTTKTTGTVHRMLVTASSEDGGEETVICPSGSITFTKEDSGKSSPEKTLSTKSTPHEGLSARSTPEPIEKESIVDSKDEAQIQETNTEKNIDGKDSTVEEISKDKEVLDDQDDKIEKDTKETEIKTKEDDIVEDNASLAISSPKLSGKSTPDIKIEDQISDKMDAKEDIQSEEKISKDDHETENTDKDLIEKDTKTEVDDRKASDGNAEVSNVKIDLKQEKQLISDRISPDIKDEISDTSTKEDVETVKELSPMTTEHVELKQDEQDIIKKDNETADEIEESIVLKDVVTITKTSVDSASTSVGLDKEEDKSTKIEPELEGEIESSKLKADVKEDAEQVKDLKNTSEAETEIKEEIVDTDKQIDIDLKEEKEISEKIQNELEDQQKQTEVGVKEDTISKQEKTDDQPQEKEATEILSEIEAQDVIDVTKIAEDLKDISTAPHDNEIQTKSSVAIKESSDKAIPSTSAIPDVTSESAEILDIPTVDLKPELKIDISNIEKSGKSSPDLVTSGTLTSDIKEDLTNAELSNLIQDTKDCTGKSTPELNEDGKDIPETIADSGLKLEEMHDSGMSPPELKATKEASGTSSPVHIDEKKSSSGKSSPKRESDIKELADDLEVSSGMKDDKSEISGTESLVDKVVEIIEKTADVISVEEAIDIKEQKPSSGKTSPKLESQNKELESIESIPTTLKEQDAPHENNIDEVDSGKSSPNLKDDRSKSILSVTSEKSGKSTPNIKEDHITPVATPEVQDIKDLSGKSTPDIKLTGRKSIISITSEQSGKSTPDLKPDDLPSGLTVDVHDIKDLSGRSTPEIKINLSCDQSGKSSPDLEEHVSDIQDIIAHVSSDMKPGDRTSIVSITSEQSGKSTPDLKASPISIPNIHDIKTGSEEFISDIKPAERKSIVSLTSEQSDKTEDDTSPRATPDILDTKVELITAITEKAGESTPEVKALASEVHDTKTESGKSTPDIKKEIEEPLISKTTEKSGKSTPDITTTPDVHVIKSESGKSTPDIKHEIEKGLSSEILEKSGKATPDITATTPEVHDIKIDSGKSTPDVKSDSRKSLTSEEADKSAIVTPNITASTPEVHDIKIESGKSTPDIKCDIRKSITSETADKSGIVTPDIAATTPDVHDIKNESGKSTPDIKHEIRKSLTSEISEKSGKSTPDITATTSDIHESKPESGKSTPDIKHEIIKSTTLETTDKSGKTTPDITAATSEVHDIKHESGKSTPDIKHEIRKSLTSETTEKSGKSTPDITAITPDVYDTKTESGKSTPDIKHEIRKSLTSETSEKSGKSTPDIIATSSECHDIKAESSTSTQDIKIDQSQIDDSVTSQQSGKSTPDIKTTKSELHDIKSESGRESPDIKCDVSETITSVTSTKSGKSTPDIKETSEKVHTDKSESGKSTPDIKGETSCALSSETSGNSVPDIKALTPEVNDIKSLSGKSTPDITSQHSGKSTPDIKVTTSDVLDTKGESEKTTSDVKYETTESVVIVTNGKSGKSTPETKATTPDIKLESGKTTPDIKCVISEAAALASSEKSGKSTPDIKSPTPEICDVIEESGKATPDIKCEVSETIVSIKNDKSGKSTPDIKEPIYHEIKSDSGKSTPDIKQDVVNNMSSLPNEQSGKSTPDIKGSSGKSTPDIKCEIRKSIISTTSDISGKSTPDFKVNDSAHDTLDKSVTCEQTGMSTPEPVRSTPDIYDVYGRSTPDEKCGMRKTMVSITSDQSGKSTPDLKHDTTFAEIHDFDHTLDMKTAEQSTMPISSKQSGTSTPDLKDESENTTTEAPISNDTKELSDKSTLDLQENDLTKLETTIVVNVKTDLKIVVPTEKDTKESQSNVITSELSVAGPSNLLREDSISSSGQISPSNKDIIHLSSEELHLSGKSTPDIADVERMKEIHEILKHEKHIPGSSTPPTVPVSPIVKETFTLQTEEQKLTEKKELSSVEEKEQVDEKELDITSISEITETVKQSGITTTSTTTTVTKKVVDDLQLFNVITEIPPASKDEPSEIPHKSTGLRCSTPGSDDCDFGGVSSPHSDISSGQMSRVPHAWGHGSSEEHQVYSDDDDVPGSPTSVTSQMTYSPSTRYTEFEIGSDKSTKIDPMISSFYGALPDDSAEESSVTSSESKVQSQPIPMTTKSHLEYSTTKDSEKRFLEDADLDFEKAMLEHRQTRGTDLISDNASDSTNYKYEITQAKYSKAIKETSMENGKDGIPMKDIAKNGFDKDCDIEQKLKTDSPKKSSEMMTSSFIEASSSNSQQQDIKKDPIETWGKPLGLPSPALPPSDMSNKTTPKKMPASATLSSKNKINDERKRSESPSKYKKNKNSSPVYLDLTYVPHHGNSYYSFVEFFKSVRARYYVFSGTEPSRDVYNALLEAKQTWEDKELEVTIIPTYDTDVLGYWVAENEDLLAKYKIDLSPSASRCTINLQDHETSCSAYRLEF